MNYSAHFTPDEISAEGMRRQQEAIRQAEFDAAYAAAGGPPPGKNSPAPPVSRLAAVDPSTLFGQPVPVRQWIVPDWLPVGYVTLLYADGGTGKTLLAQQLATSCATGTPWCGLAVEPCKTFSIFCEDDEAEMHRRQHDICGAYGLNMGQLGNMRWACPIGQDNALIRFESGNEPILTERFHEVLEDVKAFGARLLIIDTAADTFPGNENDRGQVRQYIGHALTRIAQEIGGAVLVNAHPSRSGMSASGDLDGGSTGWSNSARSRWSLVRPETEEGAGGAEANQRILTRRKSNHASIGDQIKLRWEHGALVAEGRPATGGYSAVARLAEVEAVFLAQLKACTEIGQDISAVVNAGNYAPRFFFKRPDKNGCSKRELETALHSLMTSRRIRVEAYGRSGDVRKRIVAVPETEAGAADETVD